MTVISPTTAVPSAALDDKAPPTAAAHAERIHLESALASLRRGYVTCLLLLWGIGGTIFALVPVARPIFVDEDSLMETATAGLGMTTALLGLGMLLSRPAGLVGGRFWSLAGFTLLALLFMLDELSWGERIFGFEPPVVGGRKRIDSVHDGVGVLRVMSGSREAFRVIWFVGTAAVLTGLWLARNTRPLRFVRQRVLTTPLFFLAAFAVLCYFAMTLDEYAIPRFEGSMALEEMLEFSAVFTLTFGVLALIVGSFTSRRPS